MCITHFKLYDGDDVVPVSEDQYQTIREAAAVRQQHAADCHRLNDICCQIPGNFESDKHGVHRRCYKRFTNVSRLRIDVEPDTSGPIATHSVRTSQRAANVRAEYQLMPQNECIFCGKERKYVKGKGGSEYLSKCVTEMAAANILDSATALQDYSMLGKISGVNLIAREARYHESCEVFCLIHLLGAGLAQTS